MFDYNKEFDTRCMEINSLTSTIMYIYIEQPSDACTAYIYLIFKLRL